MTVQPKDLRALNEAWERVRALVGKRFYGQCTLVIQNGVIGRLIVQESVVIDDENNGSDR